MKRSGLLIAVMVIGMMLSLNAGEAVANPGLESACIYNLFYYSGSDWVQVFPEDNPVYNGSTLWKYSYTLINTTPSPGTNIIDWWHVFTNTTYTSNITQYWPTGWNGDGSENGIPTGVYGNKVQWSSTDIDVYYLAPGSSLSGFEYTFNWSDLDNIPGSQHYEAGNDGSNSGETTPTPEPASVMLLSMGLFGFVGALRRKFMA